MAHTAEDRREMTETEALPDIMAVVEAAKARYVAAVNRDEGEEIAGDVSVLMTGGTVSKDPSDRLIDLIVYAHAVHEAALTARLHGRYRQSDAYQELGQVLLRIAATDMVQVFSQIVNHLHEVMGERRQ